MAPGLGRHVLITNIKEPVWQTIDGRQTRRSLGKLVRPKDLNGLSFPSAQAGWVVGSKGFIACGLAERPK